jgi:DinB superfamily
MKTVNSLFALVFLFVAGRVALAQQAPAAQQPPALQTVSQVVDNSVSKVERGLVGAADAMPEDKYSFVPTSGDFKGVRTFALHVKHVATSNYFMAAAILKQQPPVELGTENGPVSMTSKADIMKFLKDSFVYLHKAAAAINDQSGTEQIQNPEGQGTVPKLDVMTRQLWHDMDHYGQMVIYLRLNGIIPPASRRRAQ